MTNSNQNPRSSAMPTYGEWQPRMEKIFSTQIHPAGKTSFATDKVNTHDAELIRSTAVNMTTTKLTGQETLVESCLGPTAGTETLQLLEMLDNEDFVFSEKYLR